MRFVLALSFALSVLVGLFVFPTPAAAHHGLMSSDACGTYTYDADLRKGRRDSMVIHVTHTEGCFTYDYTNYAPAGYGEAQGNAWQMKFCDRAKYAAVAHFYYYRHMDIDPNKVKVTCTPYPADAHD